MRQRRRSEIYGQVGLSPEVVDTIGHDLEVIQLWGGGCVGDMCTFHPQFTAYTGYSSCPNIWNSNDIIS